MKDKALANKAKTHFRKREKLKRERELATEEME